MIELTADQWQRYEKKYGRLLWRIAHMISGDSMLAAVDDNYSDLCIAALESIEGFHKKTGKTVDEMFDMKLFDQYTKTCLWTAKARKGIRLTERMPFRNKTLSIDAAKSDDDDYNPLHDIPDSQALKRFSRVEAEDFISKQPEMVKKIANAISECPDILTDKGEIQVKPLAEKLGMSIAKVSKYLDKCEKKEIL